LASSNKETKFSGFKSGFYSPIRAIFKESMFNNVQRGNKNKWLPGRESLESIKKEYSNLTYTLNNAHI